MLKTECMKQAVMENSVTQKVVKNSLQ